jgi:hypothetical protein
VVCWSNLLASHLYIWVELQPYHGSEQDFSLECERTQLLGKARFGPYTSIPSSRVDIVCLQETKFAAVPQQTLLAMLGSDFLNYIELPSIGASGGILVAWRNSVGITG